MEELRWATEKTATARNTKRTYTASSKRTKQYELKQKGTLRIHVNICMYVHMCVYMCIYSSDIKAYDQHYLALIWSIYTL
jgi:hypothetical protein